LDRAELVRLQVELRRETRLRVRAKREKRVQQLLAAGVRPAVATIDNSIGVRLALVPPGGFFMGSTSRGPSDFDEMPRPLGRLTRPFYLGITEITQGQWREVMGDNPSYFGPQGPGAGRTRKLERRNLPVENVSYNDVIEFCKQLSSRP